MLKKTFFFSMVMALVLSTMVSATLAAEGSLEGKTVKLADSSALYYIGVDGSRYVFPSEKAYKSWFSDFSGVETVTMEELNEYPLVGNIRFRPGVLLLKIQSDPKVYAVAKNGTLRWIKTEGIAKSLYGDNWNQFVDDISAAFFVNYAVGAPISSASEFNPDSETEENDTIDDNRGRGKALGITKRGRKADTKRCRGNSNKRICRIGEDLEDNDSDEDDDDSEGKKVKVCHMPPGNPDAAETLEVGAPALAAHLRHGDVAGECEGEGEEEDDDVTAPIISDITFNPSPATSTATSTISWLTDELSTSKVTYATSSIATSTNLFSVSDSTSTTSHELILEDLVATTTYYFFVESEDESGNVATSTEDTFDVE